jgi:cyclic pyranopterin phosphate synthase
MIDPFARPVTSLRVSVTGTLYMCLGQSDAAELRAPLRASRDDANPSDAVDEAISRKPKGHNFTIERDRRKPAVVRHMSVTSG